MDLDKLPKPTDNSTARRVSEGLLLGRVGDLSSLLRCAAPVTSAVSPRQ